MTDYSFYAFMGVAVVGIAASMIQGYQRRRLAGKIIQKSNELSREAEGTRAEVNNDFQRLFKKVDDLTGKL